MTMIESNGEELTIRSLPSATHMVDPWTFYDFKTMFDSGYWSNGDGPMVPRWVGPHARRLMAYVMLEDAYRNGARNWLGSQVSADDRSERREYGDAHIVVETALSSLLGIDQSIVVPEAVKSDDTVEPDAGAVEYQKILLEWADNDQYFMKINENERASVKLGDAVYVVGWDEDNERPTVEPWDPGFYFPVLDPERPTSAYPRKVHLAFEYERTDESTGRSRRFVYKRTWELVELMDPNTGAVATRNYPWNDRPSKWTCLYTEGEWELTEDIKNGDTYDLDWASGKFKVDADGNVMDNFDLEQDYIPIIHMPNTVALQEHFGQSVLAPGMQILDDISSTDTDLQASSATTGTPPIAVNGMSGGSDLTAYGPGTVLWTGEGGATMIDTSRSLDALLGYSEHLLSRLSVNLRIPEALLGRVKPNEVPSGIALTLSFSPHTSMVTMMRLVRSFKHKILLKFVGREMLRREQVDKLFTAELHFGSFLPADKQEAMTLVTQLYEGKIISLETAVVMLVMAGYPIEDAQAEVQRIRSYDYESANELLDATGDANLVRQRLNLSPAPPAPPTPPAPVIVEETALPPGP